MHEIPDGSIHLMVTSPPYYNAPFDYPELFKNYEEFLNLLRSLAKELHRVLADGRIAAFVTDDMLVNGEKYPVVADITRIMREAGFRYRDRIIWRKPEGYIRISRRSGVVLRNPYPMYFYPDNIQESILIFQKGRFNYNRIKQLSPKIREASKINKARYLSEKWNLTVWEITNVLPKTARLEKGIAAFPEEIPSRLIQLFSFTEETILDPFLGSGTTIKTAQQLGRNSIGYEIDQELLPIIQQKINQHQPQTRSRNNPVAIEIIKRKDARKLRTHLQNLVKAQKSVVQKTSKPILKPTPQH
ncbi:MAG: site-specific DNA-methyltransferase [Thaumarchaeota archaeon]|nr:site-specific DNA-methyltransferase [Nitrososphaerota archaeon]MCL5317739.1 site-specific DNA-methyltransferase [Nitrososphaerota archaeon]